MRVAERRHLGEIQSNPELEWPGSTLKNVLHGPDFEIKADVASRQKKGVQYLAS